MGPLVGGRKYKAKRARSKSKDKSKPDNSKAGKKKGKVNQELVLFSSEPEAYIDE